MVKALKGVTLLFSYMRIVVSSASVSHSDELNYMCVVQPPKGNGNHKAVAV